jgi:hypothetical protein
MDVSWEREVFLWCKQVFLGKDRGHFPPWLITLFLGTHRPLSACPSKGETFPFPYIGNGSNELK